MPYNLIGCWHYNPELINPKLQHRTFQRKRVRKDLVEKFMVGGLRLKSSRLILGLKKSEIEMSYKLQPIIGLEHFNPKVQPQTLQIQRIKKFMVSRKNHRSRGYCRGFFPRSWITWRPFFNIMPGVWFLWFKKKNHIIIFQKKGEILLHF